MVCELWCGQGFSKGWRSGKVGGSARPPPPPLPGQGGMVRSDPVSSKDFDPKMDPPQKWVPGPPPPGGRGWRLWPGVAWFICALPTLLPVEFALPALTVRISTDQVFGPFSSRAAHAPSHLHGPSPPRCPSPPICCPHGYPLTLH